MKLLLVVLLVVYCAAIHRKGRDPTDEIDRQLTAFERSFHAKRSQIVNDVFVAAGKLEIAGHTPLHGIGEIEPYVRRMHQQHFTLKFTKRQSSFDAVKREVIFFGFVDIEGENWPKNSSAYNGIGKLVGYTNVPERWRINELYLGHAPYVRKRFPF
ncbi:unnamed protein product [Caenorhabditis auriculariae]|uniref:SnoaL-like domain-containing protein n=1 Tax=Caenorhabditis auriculariae TaxID=2777116 RepID=A0A8S1GWK2_9PELO|nr:unnamed protein product [Caenorhabditis auriculariae]